MPTRLIALTTLALFCTACASTRPDLPEAWDGQARALTDGRVFVAPPITFARRTELEADLRAARAELDKDPTNEQALIWYGRRLAYLYRYAEAIDVFGRGVEMHPTSYRLLRHRGHRYITVRRFDHAERDLTKAAELAEGTIDEIEPDGAPNAAGVPLSTDHSNIWYHLALAQYLQGKFYQAERSWARCVEIRRDNDDSLVASTYWHYLTLCRLGLDTEAAAAIEPIRADMTILENVSYHAALLMFKGERTADDLRTGVRAGRLDASTVGYALGMAALLSGDAAGAKDEFQNVIEETNWMMFGHIAAEAELARMK